jgi:hypothetical protein
MNHAPTRNQYDQRRRPDSLFLATILPLNLPLDFATGIDFSVFQYIERIDRQAARLNTFAPLMRSQARETHRCKEAVMWTGNDDWLVRERQRALLEEVEQRQLISLVQSEQTTRSVYYRSALFWVGQRLTGWGVRLQERYAPQVC